MSANSKIEWTDATWNPVSGCSKVSQGCKNCYAERLWPKVAGAEAKRTGQPPRAFTDVRCHPERLEAPLRWRESRRIFVNSMSDLFHEDVPDAFILEVFEIIRQSNSGHSRHRDRVVTRHTFQILTKRPERMRDFCNRLRYGRQGLYLTDDETDPLKNPVTLMGNLWLGVSVEDQATAAERFPHLWSTRAQRRFISYEPALGPLSLMAITIPSADVIANAGWHDVDPRAVQIAQEGHDVHLYDLGGLDWVIAGGESGPGARPAHPDWFHRLRLECSEYARIPFFFKQWGEWRPMGKANDDHLRNIKGAMFFPGLDYVFKKVGKKAAGRHLGGMTYDQFPAP